MSTANAGKRDALAWLRGAVWECLEFWPMMLGGLIIAWAGDHNYLSNLGSWVFGIAGFFGFIIWKSQSEKKQTKPNVKQFEIVENPNYIAEKEATVWFRFRCFIADELLWRAYLAAPLFSERHARLGKYSDDYDGAFHKKRFVQKVAVVQPPTQPERKYQNKYTAFMLAHPVFEGCVWLIPGILLALIFGLGGFLIWEDDGAGFKFIFSTVLTILSLLMITAGVARLRQAAPKRPKSLAASAPRDTPFEDKRPALNLGALARSIPAINLPSIIRFGRTTPRAAALIDASRCWGVIFAAWIIAEQFVPVWSYEAFPTDERAYVWYAAFAVMGVAFGGYIYLSRKAQGPADYRLMGRAILQFGIGAGLVFASSWLGGKLGASWPDNTFGLIAIWLLVTATARIITLPWFPSIKQLRRR